MFAVADFRRAKPPIISLAVLVYFTCVAAIVGVRRDSPEGTPIHTASVDVAISVYKTRTDAEDVRRAKGGFYLDNDFARRNPIPQRRSR